VFAKPGLISRLILTTPRSCQKRTMVVFFYQDHNSAIQLVSLCKHDEEIDGTLSFLPGYEHLEFVDCCNGLVLCEYRSNYTSADILRFIVCNPATQEWTILPDTQRNADKFYYTAKLCFDPSQSPHFYVFNFHKKRGIYNSVLGVSQVEMFSSCKSTWLVNSDLRDPENNDISVCGRPHVFIDGFLHVHTDCDVLVLDKLETAWAYHPVIGPLSCHSTGVTVSWIVASEVALVNMQGPYTTQWQRRMVAQF